MNRRRESLQAVGVSIFVLFTMGVFAQTLSSSLTASLKPSSCSTIKHKHFDCWVGDWDAFGSDSIRRAAQVRVQRILDDCVLWERFEDLTDLREESFSIDDAARKLWHQTWVTNRGQLLTMAGHFQRGEMVLVGDGLPSEGQQSRIRGTWKAVSDGVRETAVISSDEGKTWQPWFDLQSRHALLRQRKMKKPLPR